jgi:hypothetical protein
MSSPTPVCTVSNNEDIRHTIEVENFFKVYDVKVTCTGCMPNHEGCVKFECATDGGVTDDTWPNKTKWIEPLKKDAFCHVALRGVAPGTERIDATVEAEAAGGWVREDPPGQLVIHVSGQ